MPYDTHTYVHMIMPFSGGMSVESLVNRAISLSSISHHRLNSLRHCSTATPIVGKYDRDNDAIDHGESLNNDIHHNNDGADGDLLGDFH